jgi:hypothetical protein
MGLFALDLFLGPRKMQAHTARFKLVWDTALWLKEYEERRDPLLVRGTVYDQEDKTYSMLYATFQTLARLGQLRVRRRENRQEIDVLDDCGLLAVTLSVCVEDPTYGDIRCFTHTRPVMGSETLMQIGLALPALPDFPEFRDEDGAEFDLKESYYPLYIQIERGDVDGGLSDFS